MVRVPFDHAVDHGVFRAAVLQTVARQKQYGAADESGLALHLGDEGLDVEIGVGPVAGVQKAVEDQQRGPVPLGFAAKQLDDRAQPLVAQRLEDADIDDLVAQLASVEKIERGERLENPLDRKNVV